jgi:hypothetical protein
MKPIFRSITDKRPILQDWPPRPQIAPKLTISKRIIGDWHLEKKFDRFPKDFGDNSHERP